MDARSGMVLSRRLATSIWRRAGLANLGGAMPLIVLGGLYVRRIATQDPDVPLFWIGVLMAVVIYVPMWIGTWWFAYRLLQRATAWVGERDPTDDDHRATAALTRRIALWPAPWWAAACVVAVVVITSLPVETTVSEILVGAVGIILGGIVSCGLCYLLIEDALRPLFRLTLAHAPAPAGSGMGVRSRLVVYWLVGSGAYLTGIALILINFPPESARLIAIACCAIGGIVGLVMTNLSATSITGPLDSVRAGMRRVESGDLDVSLEVDDLGDVGLLQAGFNRMLGGLRERARIQELFGRHVGREVVERALSSDQSLAGEERYVSILFVDVIGSTSLATERPPTAVVATLNALFEAVVRIVGREGGLVNQFQGDGALCIFGAPDELPDHAERALRAAFALRNEIDQLARVYPGFGAAIGVSSGRVVAGDIGPEARHEYTVIGDPVNEASRLCDEAKRRSARALAAKPLVDDAGAAAREWCQGAEVVLRGRGMPTIVYEPRY